MATPNISLSNYATPPTFPNAEKFNSTNWLPWNKAVLVAARLRGARGYLEGTTLNPVFNVQLTPTMTTMTTTPSPTTTTPTPWTSTTPSEEEWDAHDAWTMALITWNVKNPIGLGVKTDRTAVEAWTSLTSQYQVSSDLAAVLADTEL